ncbi:MAG: HAMP domain-containing histidine kinase [Fusicatenibacter sp.]|nr:HAMP domain-containing histidine kinase [Fusicatenibacter sp.]
MLKKMKHRFILAAMVAFGIVMLSLAVGINLLNFFVTVSRQDDRIAGIMEYEQMKDAKGIGDLPRISDMPWADGPEADFTIRFFAVRCDNKEQIVRVSEDHISAVDTDAIEKYTRQVLSEDRQKGYCDQYRYMVKKEDTGVIIVFLNVSDDWRFVKSLLWVSLVIALISLILVFFLVVIFSNKAIRPYTRNIERQKRFITDASHELKTPLTSIATSADILAMEYEEDEWIANIQKQTVRLSRLVSDLVTLSRLDEEIPFPDETVFSVSDAAWEIAEPFASLAKAEEKNYTQKIEENLKMTGDQAALQQMLSILLDNALRYSGEGGEIHLEIYRRYGRICMEVYNTCDLLDTTDLNRLFDRFYRPDESRSRNTGGNGIGLSMAQAIAESHGGKITVKSKNGKDILFRVVL